MFSEGVSCLEDDEPSISKRQHSDRWSTSSARYFMDFYKPDQTGMCNELSDSDQLNSMLEELAPIRQEFERSLRDMAILEWQLSASDKVVASAQAELDSVASQLCLAPGASVEESLEWRPSGAFSAAISLHGDASSSSAAEIRAPLDPVLALERCSREVARLKGAIRRILPQFAALQTRLRVLLDGQRRAVPRAAHDAALQELASAYIDPAGRYAPPPPSPLPHPNPPEGTHGIAALAALTSPGGPLLCRLSSLPWLVSRADTLQMQRAGKARAGVTARGLNLPAAASSPGDSDPARGRDRRLILT